MIAARQIMYFVLFSCLLAHVSACQKEEEFVEKKVEQAEEKREIAELPFDTSLPGREGVENAIKAYNLAMRNALINDGYLKLLRKYATEQETQRVYIDIEYDTLKGVAMRSWQRELSFDNISVAENSASVATTETWDFEYVDLKTKEVTEPRKKFIYHLQYLLEKEESRWVISKIKETEPTQVTEIIPLNVRGKE